MNLYSIVGRSQSSFQTKKVYPKLKELFLLCFIVFLGFLGTSFVILSYKGQASHDQHHSICIHQMDVSSNH